MNFDKATFDTSTSKSRGSEWAHDMLTCVRPSHRVWLCGKNRFADGQEVLRSHGIFAEDFHDPNIILNMDPSLALDIGGNAFSTTALISKLLCTMVNAQPWRNLAKYATPRPGVLNECRAAAASAETEASEPCVENSDQPPEPPCKKRKTARNSKKRKSGDTETDTKDETTPEGDPKSSGTDKKQNRGHNKKGSLLTISKKMEILKTYEDLKLKEKHPEKAWCTKHVL